MNAAYKTLAIGLALYGLAATSMAEIETETETETRAAAPAWSPRGLHQTLADMPAGDAERGAALHEQMFCAACHGASGVAPSRNYPSLAGQRVEYTYKMLLDYRDARRNEHTGQARVMAEIVRLLDEQDMADVAAFYARQPLPPGAVTAEQLRAAERLARKGDPKRLLTPCASCHGANGEGGRNDTPALAGQVPEYFIRTMHAYRHGARDNDVNEGMSQFARELSDEEVRSLASYYAAMGDRP
jgi:cytochrome c553